MSIAVHSHESFPIPLEPLQGWHQGEISLQRRLGFHEEVEDMWQIVRSTLPNQHRVFHQSNINFLPLTVKASDGRLWTGILSGENGSPGFVASPRQNLLVGRAKLWEGDPLLDSAEEGGGMQENRLCAGVGIEFHTRRRNKLAGTIVGVIRDPGQFVEFGIIVNEATGNCPKYIHARPLESHPSTNPKLQSSCLNLGEEERLPQEVIDFIRSQPIIYLGTAALRQKDGIEEGHLGTNHRGGTAGFVRVRNDGRTIVIPDYSGNRFMSSLGNIEVTPLASVTIPDFKTGTVLYLTGKARNLLGEDAIKIMPRTKLLTTVEVTGYRFVKDALPFRVSIDSDVAGKSPYSPPVRFLTEEKDESAIVGAGATVSLVGVKIHRPQGNIVNASDLPFATFEFEVSSPKKLEWKAGQYAIIDFSEFSGSGKVYNHMAEYQPKIVNDDGIRTWTISSSPSKEDSNQRFSLTMKQVPNGIITPQLFFVAQSFEKDISRSPLAALKLPLLGVGGEFVLTEEHSEKVLWIAGGIGVTPFLSFIRFIGSSEKKLDAVLLLTTRDPQILLHLLAESCENFNNPNFRIQIKVFPSQPLTAPPEIPSVLSSNPNISLSVFDSRRIKLEDLQTVEGLRNRKTFICGPSKFEEDMIDHLVSEGVEKQSIVRESFNF